MGKNHHRTTSLSSRMRIKHFGGEIVEVEGGHIVRSIGRKDRHSKVCTAKGPRDRRVRLSALTAIQFYDVQDRLGYDRPSKAVDWLIKKAKSSIDQLAELPPWNPLKDTNTSTATANDFHVENQVQQRNNLNNNNNNNYGFLPTSLISDEIADTINKSLFPLGASSETSRHSQDLQLSLHHEHYQSEPGLFSESTALGGFSGCSSGWEEHHHHHYQQQQQHPAEIGRFQRLFAWNSSSCGGGADTGCGFLFGTPLEQPLLPSDFDQNSQFFSQRGPLQSSNMPFVRAWIEQPTDEDYHHHHQIPQDIHHQAGIGFTTSGVFSGFQVPSRIQGEEEKHNSFANKLSSASSDSHHW